MYSGGSDFKLFIDIVWQQFELYAAQKRKNQQVPQQAYVHHPTRLSLSEVAASQTSPFLNHHAN